MFTAEPFDPFVNFSVDLFHLFQKRKNQKKKKKNQKYFTIKLSYDFNCVSVKLSYDFNCVSVILSYDFNCVSVILSCDFNCVLTPTSYARPNY